MRINQGATETRTPRKKEGVRSKKLFLLFQPRARKAMRRAKGRINNDCVRRSNNNPNMPPAASALVQFLRSSQRRANRQASRISKRVGKSTSRVLVSETRVLDEISKVVHSRKMANMATITPAGRLCIFFPRKYKTTGIKASTRVWPAMIKS